MEQAKKQRKLAVILEMQEVCIRRGNVSILQDVSWRVQANEHWVILGANGSGKTSLLSALTGYLMPTSGQMTLLGRRYGRSDWRELRTRIGLVSSAVRQMMPDHETPIETIVSGRYAMIDLWGNVSEEDRSKAVCILKEIECEHLAERPWGVLSQGERQRVLIGRALMAKPEVLILDEPCAGLDPAAREHFLQFLQRLGRRNGGPALILVTHHVEEIMPVFSHVLVMRSGRVLAAGNKEDVLRSSTLSKAFDAAIQLQRRNGHYRLTVARKRGAII
jgi:iron complex transport system ATP-binding protein